MERIYFLSALSEPGTVGVSRRPLSAGGSNVRDGGGEEGTGGRGVDVAVGGGSSVRDPGGAGGVRVTGGVAGTVGRGGSETWRGRSGSLRGVEEVFASARRVVGLGESCTVRGERRGGLTVSVLRSGGFMMITPLDTGTG